MSDLVERAVAQIKIAGKLGQAELWSVLTDLKRAVEAKDDEHAIINWHVESLRARLDEAQEILDYIVAMPAWRRFVFFLVNRITWPKDDTGEEDGDT